MQLFTCQYYSQKVPEAASTGFIDTQPSSSSRYPRRITPKQPVGRPYLNEGHPGNRVVSLPNHLKDEALESALLEFDPHHAPDPIQNRVVSMPEYFISQSPRSPSPNHMHSRNRKEPPDFEPLIDFSSPCQEGELSAELSRSELPSDFSQGSLIDYGSPITPPQHERTVELSTDYGQSDVSSVIFIMEPPTHRTPVYPGASQDRAVKPPKDYFKKEPNTFVADLPTSTGGTQTGGDFWGSPPRPIPALHGPSSLPYARCPS